MVCDNSCNYEPIKNYQESCDEKLFKNMYVCDAIMKYELLKYEYFAGDN